MAFATLVGFDVEFGAKILDFLDTAKFPAPVALWVRWEGQDHWHFVIGTPLYDRLGLGGAYHKLVEALKPYDVDFVYTPFRLESTRRPFIRALRQRYKKSGRTNFRIGTQTIGDTWVDEGFVYRVR